MTNPYEGPRVDSLGDEAKPSSPRRGRLVRAGVRVTAGLAILGFAFTVGARDESSMGTVFFLWGSLFAFAFLVLPGVFGLVRALMSGSAK